MVEGGDSGALLRERPILWKRGGAGREYQNKKQGEKDFFSSIPLEKLMELLISPIVFKH